MFFFYIFFYMMLYAAYYHFIRFVYFQLNGPSSDYAYYKYIRRFFFSRRWSDCCRISRFSSSRELDDVSDFNDDYIPEALSSHDSRGTRGSRLVRSATLITRRPRAVVFFFFLYIISENSACVH